MPICLGLVKWWNFTFIKNDFGHIFSFFARWALHHICVLFYLQTKDLFVLQKSLVIVVFYSLKSCLWSSSEYDISYFKCVVSRYIFYDFIYGEYPEYPYHTIQYDISGKPISAIYFASKDCQYLYNPDGEFVGVWYKHNLYDKHSKVILTRTTY